MKNEALYNKTVGILVDAYFNDTLKHGYCQACAVGNLVAFYTDQKNRKGKYECTTYNWSGPVRKSMFEETDELGLSQVKATGYSAKQLLQIEQAFESTRWGGKTYDEEMFNGLMAVIDCLDEIHENKDTQISESSKSKFQKPVLEKIIE